ncbi:MAG: serine/threonine-protein kinase RsbW, partial [Pseudonocardiales bacterium]|nr:serine/threonine-protein kinase RsbW [Pseudonocardiales bacterium]
MRAGPTTPSVDPLQGLPAADTREEHLALFVSDHGRWRPIPDDNGYRGHGLGVMREFTEQLRIDRGPAGTDVRFVLPAP